MWSLFIPRSGLSYLDQCLLLTCLNISSFKALYHFFLSNLRMSCLWLEEIKFVQTVPVTWPRWPQFSFIYGLHLMKMCLQAYADSEIPDQPFAFAQSDQGLPCPLTASLNTTDCMNGEQKASPRRFFAHMQDDRNLHILHIFSSTFSLDMAQMVKTLLQNQKKYWDWILVYRI